MPLGQAEGKIEQKFSLANVCVYYLQQICAILHDCLQKFYENSKSWSSLVAGDEGSYLANRQTNLDIALCTLSLLLSNFINTTAYLWADMSLHLPLPVVLPDSLSLLTCPPVTSITTIHAPKKDNLLSLCVIIFRIILHSLHLWKKHISVSILNSSVANLIKDAMISVL